MVTAMQRTLAAVLVMLSVSFPGWCAAAVIASVDRDEVELNESFTLKVIVDSAIEVVPDVSALDQDFYIGSTSQLSNTTIVNGQISRSRTWHIRYQRSRSHRKLRSGADSLHRESVSRGCNTAATAQ